MSACTSIFAIILCLFVERKYFHHLQNGDNLGQILSKNTKIMIAPILEDTPIPRTKIFDQASRRAIALALATGVELIGDYGIHS